MILLIVTNNNEQKILQKMIDKLTPALEPFVEAAIGEGVVKCADGTHNILKASGADVVKYLAKIFEQIQSK